MPHSNTEYRPCNRCYQNKHVKEYLQTCIPLQEIANGAWNQPEAKLVASCRECRERRKSSDQKRNETRRQRLDENRPLIDVYSWEQVLVMIEQKFHFK
jgi:hypothetical protein